MASKEASRSLIKENELPAKIKKISVFEIISLSLTTVILLATFVVNGLAASNDATKFGFKNGTGRISDEFYTEITPAGWTFAIWGIIYAWQTVWILYGWSFVFRPSFKKTITPIVYLLYGFTNISNIIWIYLWGNEYPQVAFPFLFLIAVSLWAAVGVEVVYLYKQLPLSDHTKWFKLNFYITQIVVVNGLAIYATWVTIATLINFSIVLQYYANLDGTDVGTAALSILTFLLSLYFILENTILDRFLRLVFIVYLVVIWALSGVLSAHYGDDDENRRNSIFTLVLLIITIILFIIRFILWVMFAFFRPWITSRHYTSKPVV